MTEREGPCCTSSTEEPRDNPPGRSTLRYRVGTHSSFLARMLAQLSKQTVPPSDRSEGAARPLADLRTRSSDDDTIALLDAWACALDVLTFYDERYLQEGFLPTATLRESVYALAQGLGYSPSPGVAASTVLAFTVDDSANGPTSVTVPAGSAAMSVPTAAPSLGQVGAVMTPQTFETLETIEARPEWNRLRATTTKAQAFVGGLDVVWLAGVATRLAVGDTLLLTGAEPVTPGGDMSERWDLRKVAAVETDVLRGTTKVTLDRGLGDARTAPAEHPQVYVFRDRGSLFGFDAPDFRAMSVDIKVAYGGLVSSNPVVYREQWPGFQLANDTTTAANLAAQPPRGVIDLDREYAKLVQGGWVCLQSRTEVEAYRIARVSPTSRTDFTLSAKCTRLELDGYERLTRFARRATVVHLQSEQLSLSGEPDTSLVSGQDIRIAGSPTAMPAGRTIVVRGVDADGIARAEQAVLRTWTAVDGNVELRLEAPLAYAYVRESFEVLGNVASASHGSSVREPIGSGDGGLANQRFALRQSPLTWVAAPSSSGRESTLELVIDDIVWTRIDALFDAGPEARVYQLEQDSEGHTTVVLGDGRRGARAPTGLENVIARYRKGIGLAGELAAGQISLMTAGPPGLRAVTNPLPALGAEDAESLDTARRNAPQTVLTLDRLVSLSDYEDFARTFAGIGKARSAALWTGKRSIVHLTVAAASGAVLSESDPPITALRAALAAKADPSQIALVSTFEQALFGVRLRILRDAAYLPDPLAESIAAALLDEFSFAYREFAQSVAASEVVALVQATPGVVALDLDALYRVGQSEAFHALLAAKPARWSGNTIGRAELLLLSPNHIVIEWIES
jgi:predicted phage baseplate assembly protein